MTIIAVTTKGDNATDNAITIEYADLESNDADAWNGELSASSTGRIQQTVQGARIRWSMDGQRPFFLRARCGDETAGQLYMHRGFVHPDLLQWAQPLLKTAFMHRLFGVVSWFGGPVVHRRDRYEEVLRAFLAQVDDFCIRRDVAMVRNATPAFCGNESDWDRIDAIFAEFAYRKKERATIALAVDADQKALWSGLSKEARQKVRKADRQGIRVFQDNSAAGLERYYQVRLQTAGRNGLRPPSRSSILAVEPVYMGDGMCKLFLAEHEGHVVGGQLLVVFNGYVQLAGICYSDRARQLKLACNDLLQWEVIKWAQDSGHRHVDWSGFTPNPTSEKEAGINRFKEKWGGEVVHYHDYDKILAPRRYNGLEWIKGRARRFNIR
jgi:hypothetical protein